MIGKLCQKQTETHKAKGKKPNLLLPSVDSLVNKKKREKKIRQREENFCCSHKNKSKTCFILR